MSVNPAWPYGTPQDFAELFLTSPASPAAGANFLFAVPANQLWRLISVKFHVLTSAAVPVRRVQLQLNYAGQILYRSDAQFSQPASTDTDYMFAAHAHGDTGVQGAWSFGWLPIGSYIHLNAIIQSAIVGIDAADQISNIDIFYHRWIMST